MLRLPQRALALGLISLELILVGHMAFERHTMSASGDVVEVRASIALHGHDERSLCERDARDADDSRDTLCHLAPEQLPGAHRAPRAPAPEVATRPLTVLERAPAHDRLWLMAPKASPPAAC